MSNFVYITQYFVQTNRLYCDYNDLMRCNTETPSASHHSQLPQGYQSMCHGDHMTLIEQFISYAKENHGLDDHDLITTGDKFRNPSIHAQYVTWAESKSESRSLRNSHYHISAPV